MSLTLRSKAGVGSRRSFQYVPEARSVLILDSYSFLSITTVALTSSALRMELSLLRLLMAERSALLMLGLGGLANARVWVI